MDGVDFFGGLAVYLKTIVPIHQRNPSMQGRLREPKDESIGADAGRFALRVLHDAQRGGRGGSRHDDSMG